MPSKRPDDELFMRRALQLAARAQGFVEPNPMVGCVLVRNGKIVGEGFHRRFGGAHAEVEALRACKTNPRGVTAYVTLEPCCHFGKTPPCTTALIEAGVSRVVAAVRDPGPPVSGRGLRKLRAAGIRVDCGVLTEEATELIAPYVKLTEHRRPWVILKWAQSLDGKIATRNGDSKWITDQAARAHAHRTRGRVDAIIVGRATAERDDPLLTCRHARPRRVATRIVVDSRLSTAATSKLAQTARETPTWFVCGPRAPKKRRRVLERRGCAVQPLPCDDTGVSLPALLDLLGERQMTNVLVEGGGRLLGGFADQRLADELHVYVARRLIGGHAAPSALNSNGPATVGKSLAIPERARLRRLGTGWFLRCRV